MQTPDLMLEREVTTLTPEDARALIESFAMPSTVAVDKVLDYIDHHIRLFIEKSPLCFISSAGPDGTQEVSPRGDPPGSFKVLNERRLALADRPGNHRIDTFRNMIANPNLGMIFVIPGVDEMVRISGTASLSVDDRLLSSMSVEGRAPRIAIVVDVQKAHLHCAKAFRRARPWDAESRVPSGTIPPLAIMVADQVRLSEQKRREFVERTDRMNKENLWKPN